MEAIAKTKYLKGSPRKARLVIDLIRGQDVSRALSILRFTEKRAAGPIAKCLNSAIANATYQAEQMNIAIDPDELWIRSCYVDMGPTKNRRRMRPAPQGRAYREQRHYCHITIEVTSEEKPKTEKELLAEAAKAKRAASKKAEGTKKSKAGKKSAETTSAKREAEEIEEVEAPVIEETTETSEVSETVEAAATETDTEATPETSEEAEEVKAEAAEEAGEGAEETSESDTSAKADDVEATESEDAEKK
jgi:large subunit ribosomal protein L22